MMAPYQMLNLGERNGVIDGDFKGQDRTTILPLVNPAGLPFLKLGYGGLGDNFCPDVIDHIKKTCKAGFGPV